MQEFIDFLGKQSPYDRLDNSDLARLGAVLKVEYFPAGSTIIGPGIGVLEYLAVIRTGVVTILDRSSVVDELGVATPHLLAVGERAATRHAAEEDVLLDGCVRDEHDLLRHHRDAGLDALVRITK